MARKWILERVLMKCSVQNITTKCQVQVKSILCHYTMGVDLLLLGLGVKKFKHKPIFPGDWTKMGSKFLF